MLKCHNISETMNISRKINSSSSYICCFSVQCQLPKYRQHKLLMRQGWICHMPWYGRRLPWESFGSVSEEGLKVRFYWEFQIWFKAGLSMRDLDEDWVKYQDITVQDWWKQQSRILRWRVCMVSGYKLLADAS